MSLRANKGKPDPLAGRYWARERRAEINAHNALQGTLAIGREGLRQIQRSALTTPQAKSIAARLERELEALGKRIQTRAKGWEKNSLACCEMERSVLQRLKDSKNG